MTANGLRALVVDDEAAVQKLLVRALIQQGFACDTAGDGNEAEAKAVAQEYDVVVTDLKMPNKHGHALATHLLTLERRPVIVIHTGLLEPRLAKDLLARGVDDILFKPFDFGILAAKVRALVDRRHGLSSSASGRSASPGDDPDSLTELPQLGSDVSAPNLESKLAGLSRILPISKAAFDVYNMTSTDKSGSAQVAAAIQRDPTLAAEVMRLANSAFYNTTNQRIVQLDRAVIKIGQKRIGELALATNALTALTSGMVPWMNVELTWKRSMAAGLALEMLIDEGNHQSVEQGLLLSAIMYPLGRVVLGTLYPKQYTLMIEQCVLDHEALLEKERQTFKVTHAKVTSRLLEIWNIPSEVHVPLRYIFEDSQSVAALENPLRLKVELIKLATQIGEMAVGQWELWDKIELPSARLCDRCGVTSVAEIIMRVKCDVERLSTLRTDQPKSSGDPSAPVPERQLAYCNASGGEFDYTREVVTAMGIKLVEYPETELSTLNECVLINCLNPAPRKLAIRSRGNAQQQFIFLAETARVEAYKDYGRVLAVPTTFSELRAILWKASHAHAQTEEVAGASIACLA